MAYELPDDVATVLLGHAQADGGDIKVSQVVDDADAVDSYVIECKKSRSCRALACVSTQFARLLRPCLRQLGRKAYETKAAEEKWPRERLAFVEWHN